MIKTLSAVLHNDKMIMQPAINKTGKTKYKYSKYYEVVQKPAFIYKI